MGWSYLICRNQRVEVVGFRIRSYSSIIQINTVIGISKPYNVSMMENGAVETELSKKGDVLMASYCLPLLEMKTIYNGSIIGISLFNI